MNSDGKHELIWVTKDVADEYNSLDSVEEQERLVKKILRDKGLDLEREHELLSENVLRFKSVCLAHRKALEKVYQEESDTLYKMWEDLGDVTTQINEHVALVVSCVAPLKREIHALVQEIEQLKKDLQQVQLHIPERFVQLAQSVASMDEKTKLLLRELLNIHLENTL